ncbi:Csu type fimbrial protein [Ramlibacter humi]|uniref:SCPU domain-containing protein n=1 Tax=Ramlibacter humi TaxID=2530451 RepID=A0A4Z0BPC8_9BURK|nr:spore coat U domain-containing protein [Ramlibacter humi]TFZ00270.1 SCPU domain-containing protein [Ramlibacter humi]
MRRTVAIACLALQATLTAPLTHAATDTANLQVKLVITETCDIHTAATTAVDFGTQARASGPVTVTATGSVTVNCSPNTSYSIGLNGGSNAPAVPTPGQRKMKGSLGAFVPYDLYQDASTTAFWGNAAGSVVSGSGSGGNQTYQVYGKLTNVNFAADTYVDTVVATVTY